MDSKEAVRENAIKFGGELHAAGFEQMKRPRLDDSIIEGWWLDVASWGKGRPRIGLWYDDNEARDLGYWFGFYGTRQQIDELRKFINEDVISIDWSDENLSEEGIKNIRNELHEGRAFWIRERDTKNYDPHEYIGFYQEAIDAENTSQLFELATDEILYVRELAEQNSPQVPRSGLTERKKTVRVRVGLGRLDRELRRRWKGCAVTGCTTRQLLRVSHIKKWSDYVESRLDPTNCLLLTASLDALFDRGFISFEDDGRLLISRHLSDDDKKWFGLTNCLKIKEPSLFNRDYMKHHREHTLRL